MASQMRCAAMLAKVASESSTMERRVAADKGAEAGVVVTERRGSLTRSKRSWNQAPAHCRQEPANALGVQAHGQRCGRALPQRTWPGGRGTYCGARSPCGR